ncbi:hypothetical protein JOF56_003128 [Kibdelosporangium banguiense]|uniref:WXG100 family type VII secretion target n=1 Tax=Kibdelosporangium banguiense TaxID=1365924 RepID=A0ABS4TE92_9PSEU|nr:hypothetical protein [Kibdelosporangium banguiense]MBP2322743.1 hypothetical protein [Kibdelosporangium banguiense]
MAEGFKANPDHIAGYGLLVHDAGMDLSSVASWTNQWARADEGFSGLMQLLKGPVDAYAYATYNRMYPKHLLLTRSANNLNTAAWMYTTSDVNSYTTYSKTLAGEDRVEVKDFPNPVAYPPAEDPVAALKVPEAENADIRGILDEVGGSINVIDDAVNFITGWSPVSALVEPMSGNWTRLERAGEVLKCAGDGAEKVAKNLTTGLSTLDPNWNGGSAQDFNNYINNLAKGIDIEGPLNRIVAGVYKLVAQQIEKVAKWMVEVLKKAVDKIVEAAATSWIPGFGWVKIIDAVRTAINVFNEAKTLLEELDKVISAVKTVVELAQDPVGFVQGKVDEKLAPYKEKIEQAEKGYEVAKDLAELSDTSVWGKTPTGTYEVGADPKRAGA